MEDIINILKTSGVNLLYGLIILVVGFFLIHHVMKFLNRKGTLIKMEPTIKGFLINLIRIVLYILVILTAAGRIGIPLTSIITLVASAGVAISLSLQGALSNLVGGVTLLILKPIKAQRHIIELPVPARYDDPLNHSAEIRDRQFHPILILHDIQRGHFAALCLSE